MSRAFAAGRTFSSRTLKAEWAARRFHTSVVDAVSGAIYVIGGYSGGTTRYNDVYVSVDKGAWPDPVGGGRVGTGWALPGVLPGVLGGYVRGYSREYLGGTQGVLC